MTSLGSTSGCNMLSWPCLLPYIYTACHHSWIWTLELSSRGPSYHSWPCIEWSFGEPPAYFVWTLTIAPKPNCKASSYYLDIFLSAPNKGLIASSRIPSHKGFHHRLDSRAARIDNLQSSLPYTGYHHHGCILDPHNQQSRISELMHRLSGIDFEDFSLQVCISPNKFLRAFVPATSCVVCFFIILLPCSTHRWPCPLHSFSRVLSKCHAQALPFDSWYCAHDSFCGLRSDSIKRVSTFGLSSSTALFSFSLYSCNNSKWNSKSSLYSWMMQSNSSILFCFSASCSLIATLINHTCSCNSALITSLCSIKCTPVYTTPFFAFIILLLCCDFTRMTLQVDLSNKTQNN